MTHARTALFLVVLTAGLCACPQEQAAGFGDAKPIKDDGMIGKPPVATPPPPDFQNAVELASAFDKSSGKVTVTLKLKPGYHAYAPGEEIGKPVALTVDESKGGWKVDGAVTVPAGTKKDLGTLGTSMILEGDVALSAVVKGGNGNVEGVVEAQVCTDAACDRPKKHAFSVPTT